MQELYEGVTGIEPATIGSAIPCSTTELRTRFVVQKKWTITTVTGLEPVTAGSEVQRAIQLRHTVSQFENVAADSETRTRDPLLTRQVQ